MRCTTLCLRYAHLFWAKGQVPAGSERQAIKPLSVPCQFSGPQGHTHVVLYLADLPQVHRSLPAAPEGKNISF